MTTRTAHAASLSVRSGVHEEIVASVRRALRRDRALLADRPEDITELTVLACAVFDDVAAAFDAPLDGVPRGGAEWTRCGIDWGESLRAGTTLFEAVLPIALRELAPPPHASDPHRISVLLHQAILTRVVRGSQARTTFLNDRVLSARREERRRMARDLHDRVLHGIGLAIQGLDLHRYHAQTSPALARTKIDTAIGLLRQVVHTLQQFTLELRRPVADGGLEQALRSYLTSHVEPPVHVVMHTRGDLASLPAHVSEEVYLILREAARNAVRHAAPSRLEVSVTVDDRALRATLTDDGRGYLPGACSPAGGLSAMRERALGLNGQFSTTSAPGAGTRVDVRVPLGEPAP
ncbi:sensor histidine kinase [Streptomyces marincola]|uniref:sensor histidine kinase n=1 Tax=Streptomyces marincola TaxID=2878388 RepID=UPI000A33E0F6|nr:ATP-binding protein [Streptomyces marincola]